MDPNATLRLIAEADFNSEAMWNAIRDLAYWLRGGGFRPDWDACKDGSERYALGYNRRGYIRSHDEVRTRAALQAYDEAYARLAKAVSEASRAWDPGTDEPSIEHAIARWVNIDPEMVEVDPDDPAFSNPTKFIGPVYNKDDADRLAAEKQPQYLALLQAKRASIEAHVTHNILKRHIEPLFLGTAA